jgi:hypothetical protein
VGKPIKSKRRVVVGMFFFWGGIIMMLSAFINDHPSSYLRAIQGVCGIGFGWSYAFSEGG